MEIEDTSNNIIVCEQGIYLYMKDYISSFLTFINGTLMLVNKPEDVNCAKENTRYFFVQKLPNNENKYLPNVYLINTEQATRQVYWNMLSHTLNSNIKVLDYSPENIQILNNHPNISLLPYQYNENEVSLLKKYLSETPKIYDVVFVGYLSQDRAQMLNELRNKSLNLQVLYLDGKWGEERDKIIASCKILLNLHCSKDYNVYETPRCDRWVFAGMIVISETSLAYQNLDIAPLVIFKEKKDIVSTVVDVINNFDKYQEIQQIKYNQHIDKIKLDRLEKINNVLKL